MGDIDYSRHGLIQKDDSILMVIDMQERLFPAMAEKERLLENVLRLVNFARLIGLPVMATEQEKLGAMLPQIREALPDIYPISKVHFDCFSCRAFEEGLKGMKRKTIIMTGIEAHICVAQTALSALSGYRVHVVSDAVSSRASDNRRVALNRMMQAGVTVNSAEMVIYEILKKAGTEVFREVLKLVK